MGVDHICSVSGAGLSSILSAADISVNNEVINFGCARGKGAWIIMLPISPVGFIFAIRNA